MQNALEQAEKWVEVGCTQCKSGIFNTGKCTRASSEMGWCGMYSVQKPCVIVQTVLQQAVKWIGAEGYTQCKRSILQCKLH